MLFACPAAAWSAAAACRLEIEGIWRPATSLGDAPPTLLSFSANGAVTLLEPSADTPAWAFEQLASVGYDLLPRSSPERIEFDALRSNDLFARGTTVWELSSYDDERFGIRRPESESGEESAWFRVETLRYFLTLAARSGRAESGGPAAFVMWTKLDGQQPRLEAMGVYGLGDETESTRFGRVPEALAQAFSTESGLDFDVMMRIELNEAEYLRTHRVLEAWDVLQRTGFIAEDDPHRQAAELIVATLESANRCALKFQLGNVDLSIPAEDSEEARIRERPAEIIRLVRRYNDRWHVRDKTFPFSWKPLPVISAGSR